MVTNPEFNDYKIGDDFEVVLPVAVWLQIGEWLRYVDQNTPTLTTMAIDMLASAINDMIFPKSFQQSEKARVEKRMSEHNPMTQIFSSMGIPFQAPINPEDFNE